VADPCSDVRPYGGQSAVYDREYRCYVLDVRLYLDRLRHHRIRGPLLELGVGTGRVAIPLASAGHSVTGIDLSDRMLHQARRRSRALSPDVAARLRFRKADMATFRLPGPFAAILAPFSALNLLVDPAARAACLARCRDHLAPGGLLLLDAPLMPESRHDGTLPEGRHTTTIALSRYGRVMEKETIDRPDPARGISDITYRYREIRQHDGRVMRTYDVAFPMARIAPDALQDEVESAGFDVTDRFGDYLGTPFGPGAVRCVVEATRR
jgi:SAM-dependent methyltransferase